MRRWSVILLILCSLPARAQTTCDTKIRFGQDQPTNQGINPTVLRDLTLWLRDSAPQVFSLQISHQGRIVYAMRAPGIDPDDAHYLMSVTKSVTSALVGAALDRGLIQSTNQSVTDLLPPNSRAMATPGLSRVTLKNLLAMSALDAQVPPHENTQAARDRQQQFWQASSRFAFALRQPVLPNPGENFQYTDITPMIATGIVQHATGMSLFDFAQQTLFGPMGFRNAEWMHQDPSGYDNGSYGLRLRPVDMQKFGILFLAKGCWEGRQLLSRAWVKTSFTSWINSHPGLREPNYGWYWWNGRFAPGWVAHTARGWKGQRISIFPAQGIVVTMTALAEDGSENAIYDTVIKRFVIPAIETRLAAASAVAAAQRGLETALDDLARSPSRLKPGMEERMIPSSAAKMPHRKFRP